MRSLYRQHGGLHTQIDQHSHVVGYIVFSNINNEVARVRENSIRSYLIISCIVKEVKFAIGPGGAGQDRGASTGPDRATYAETSAYASNASTFFLFFSAMGWISLLAAIKSLTLRNLSSRNVLR